MYSADFDDENDSASIFDFDNNSAAIPADLIDPKKTKSKSKETKAKRTAAKGAAANRATCRRARLPRQA